MKIKAIMAVALAATFAFASCAKEDGAKNNVPTKPMTLVIKNQELNGTRGVDNVIADKTVTLKTGWVLFFTGDVIDQRIEIVETAADGKATALQLKDGYTIDEVKNTVDKVVVLANLGDKHAAVGTATNAATLSAIKWTLTNIQVNEDLSPIALWGEGNCVETASVMTATVPVAPIASRIQIPGVKLSSSFTYNLAGVFINNVYTKLDGMKQLEDKVNNGTDVDKYVASYNPTGMCDVTAIKKHANGCFPWDGAKYKSFWAYNVFPADGGSSKLPHIVFHFSDVTTAAAVGEYASGALVNGSGDVYITIGSYDGITEFQAGYIYTITTLDEKDEDDFETENDGDNPSIPGIDVPDDVVVDEDNDKPETGGFLEGKVTVAVQNWTAATIKPEW